MAAKILHPGVRQLPIVVEAGPVLPFVQLPPTDTLAGEMPHCLEHGALIRFAHIDEHAIHVENNHFPRRVRRVPNVYRAHSSGSNARRNFLICAAVPAVILTKPGRPKLDV